MSASESNEQRFTTFRGWRILLRILVTFISGVAAFYFVFWVGGALISSAHLSPWISILAAGAAAIVLFRYVWIYTASFQLGLVRSVVLGALTIGGIAFAAGFFGPMSFGPGANLGPLLGIVITGPLGFLVGAVGGAIYWFVRRRRAGGAVNDPAA